MTRRYDVGFTYDQEDGDWDFDTTVDWSMCGWIYIAASASGASGDIFFSSAFGGSGTNTRIYLGWSRNTPTNDAPALRFVCENGSGAVMNRRQAVTTGQWYHLAMVHDASAGTVTAYVDGAQVEQSTSVTLTQLHEFAEFGDFSSGASNVELAQIKVWEGYALSALELADEIDYWTPQHGASFVKAWWQFDNADQLSDSSGNGYNLVNVGTNDPPTSPSPGVQTVPGQLEPDEGDVVDVAGAMSTAVTMAAAPTRNVVGALSTAVSMVGTPTLIKPAAGAISGAVTMAAAPTRNVLGAISASITMAAVPGSNVSIAGAITAAVTLAAVPNLIKVGAGAMSATFTLAGVPVVFPLSQPGWTDPPLGAATPHGPWVSSSA